MRNDDRQHERRSHARYALEDGERLRLVVGLHGAACALGDVSASGVKVLVPPGAFPGLAVGDAAVLCCPDGGTVPADVVHLTDDAVGLRFHESWIAAVFWYRRILAKLHVEQDALPG